MYIVSSFHFLTNPQEKKSVSCRCTPFCSKSETGFQSFSFDGECKQLWGDHVRISKCSWVCFMVLITQYMNKCKNIFLQFLIAKLGGNCKVEVFSCMHSISSSVCCTDCSKNSMQVLLILESYHSEHSAQCENCMMRIYGTRPNWREFHTIQRFTRL